MVDHRLAATLKLQTEKLQDPPDCSLEHRGVTIGIGFGQAQQLADHPDGNDRAATGFVGDDLHGQIPQPRQDGPIVAHDGKHFTLHPTQERTELGLLVHIFFAVRALAQLVFGLQQEGARGQVTRLEGWLLDGGSQAVDHRQQACRRDLRTRCHAVKQSLQQGRRLDLRGNGCLVIGRLFERLEGGHLGAHQHAHQLDVDHREHTIDGLQRLGGIEDMLGDVLALGKLLQRPQKLGESLLQPLTEPVEYDRVDFPFCPHVSIHRLSASRLLEDPCPGRSDSFAGRPGRLLSCRTQPVA